MAKDSAEKHTKAFIVKTNMKIFDLLKRAAERKGLPLSTFVRSAAIEEARRILGE